MKRRPNCPQRIIRRLPLLAGLMLSVFAGCFMLQKSESRLDDELRMTVAAMNERVSPDQPMPNDDPLVVNPADHNIHLYAAGGETVAFQLVIPPTGARSLDLKIEPLTLFWSDPAAEKTLSQIHWRVYQLHTIASGAADDFVVRQEPPASLSNRKKVVDPMEELSFESPGVVPLESSEQENLLLWVEVSVPKNCPRTNFRGRIALEGGGRKVSHDLILHTWGFDLPEPGVDLIGLMDVPAIWREHQIGVLRDDSRLILPPDDARNGLLADRLGEYCRLLDENGVEPWPAYVYPRISGADPERISIDWAGYQKLVQAVLDHSSHGRKYWPAPVDLFYPQTKIFGPIDSPNYRLALATLLREFRQKWVKPGLIGKPLAVPFWPETYEEATGDYASSALLMKEWYRTESGMILMSPFIPTDLRPLGWADFSPFDQVNTVSGGFCCDEKWLDLSVIEEWRKNGKLAWWRPMKSQGSLPLPQADYPGFYSQALIWAAWKYGSTGVVLGGVNDWSGHETTLSQTSLVYPGSWFGCEKPLGSVRLKYLQRGLYDVAYMRALEKSGQKDLAEWLGRHLVRYAMADAFDGSLWTLRNDGLCNDDRAWMLPRLIAGLALARQTTSAPATQRAESDQKEFLSDLFTNQFKQFTEGFSLEVEGVRAKNVPDPATGKEKIEWSFNLVSRNFAGDAGDGILEFENIVQPCSASADRVKVSGLTWGWPVRSVLKMENLSAVIGMFGVNTQRIALKRNDGLETTLNARYCALVAGRTHAAIRIDGDLSDRAENLSALAGDFQCIRSDGINDKRLLSTDRAVTWPTTVQVDYDDRNLYLAFTCREPKESIRTLPSNTLQSSEGLPWGEDLVAVVLSPDNTASQNPLEAYQVVVKANGNVLTFRGTLTANQFRAADNWPNHVRAAVKILDDRWQVEMAIPFDDLNAAGKLGRWWGVDFARFAPVVNEFSTWSGTKNQYARPISMGNIFIGR